MTWARWVAVRAKVRNGKELELLIARKLGWQKDEASSLMDGYLAGKRSCLTTWSPNASALWVDRAEKVWQGTSDWYRTPVWYLMEDVQYHPGQLMACIQLLPRQFRMVLLSEPNSKTPAGLLLGELWPDRVYELCRPMSPWALGAMACAFRRAELAGQGPVYLRAGIGLVWALDRLAAAQDPWVREPLNQFRDLVLNRLNDVVYPGSTPIMFPISGEILSQFGANASAFIAQSEAPIDFEREAKLLKHRFSN